MAKSTDQPTSTNRIAGRNFKNWYGSKIWQRLRYYQLRKEPFCRFCKDRGDLVAGHAVDHIKPHKGEWDLFSDPSNLQTLCKTCHNGAKQRIEKSGEFGCDINGIVEAWK